MAVLFFYLPPLSWFNSEKNQHLHLSDLRSKLEPTPSTRNHFIALEDWQEDSVSAQEGNEAACAKMLDPARSAAPSQIVWQDRPTDRPTRPHKALARSTIYGEAATTNHNASTPQYTHKSPCYAKRKEEIMPRTVLWFSPLIRARTWPEGGKITSRYFCKIWRFTQQSQSLSTYTPPAAYLSSITYLQKSSWRHELSLPMATLTRKAPLYLVPLHFGLVCPLPPSPSPSTKYLFPSPLLPQIDVHSWRRSLFARTRTHARTHRARTQCNGGIAINLSLLCLPVWSLLPISPSPPSLLPYFQRTSGGRHAREGGITGHEHGVMVFWTLIWMRMRMMVIQLKIGWFFVSNTLQVGWNKQNNHDLPQREVCLLCLLPSRKKGTKDTCSSFFSRRPWVDSSLSSVLPLITAPLRTSLPLISMSQTSNLKNSEALVLFGHILPSA